MHGQRAVTKQNDVVPIAIRPEMILATLGKFSSVRPACLVEVDVQGERQRGWGWGWTPASSNCLGLFLAGKCEQGQSGASAPRRIGSHHNP